MKGVRGKRRPGRCRDYVLNYLCNLCSFDFIVRQLEGAAQSRIVECNLRLLDNLCGFNRGNRVGGKEESCGRVAATQPCP